MRKSSSHYQQFLEHKTIYKKAPIQKIHHSIIFLISFSMSICVTRFLIFLMFYYNNLVNTDKKISYFQNERKCYLSLRSRNHFRSSALQQFFCILNGINNSSLIVIIFKQFFEIGVCTIYPFCVVPVKKNKCCSSIIMDHIYCGNNR